MGAGWGRRPCCNDSWVVGVGDRSIPASVIARANPKACRTSFVDHPHRGPELVQPTEDLAMIRALVKVREPI
jgi:hypothetical protein